MNKIYIDINCDVGEGVANEAQLFPYISSCNIACGGHFGTVETMKDTVQLAIANQVKMGAHPSYPDKENFGRVSVSMSGGALMESIRNQVSGFVSILNTGGASLHHIKPHGALYNDVAKDIDLALIFLESIKAYKENTILYVPYNSVIEKEALKQGFLIKYEAFADRNYNTDLTLVSRKLENALIQEPKEVLEHVKNICLKGKVATVSGLLVLVKADTLCLHGDSSSALDILKYLSQELPIFNIEIK